MTIVRFASDVVIASKGLTSRLAIALPRWQFSQLVRDVDQMELKPPLWRLVAWEAEFSLTGATVVLRVLEGT